ncbi:hypothetical protein, partial [Oceanobacillus picturae]|uniref:hypothetical protein n=1 Tax=Oceanobacillus picturae TaxID=171693 RepID=UPI001EE7517D
MNFEIDMDLYEILNESDPQMYFSLKYPSNLYKVLSSMNSELLIGEKNNNLISKYQVIKLDKEIVETGLSIIL